MLSTSLLLPLAAAAGGGVGGTEVPVAPPVELACTASLVMEDHFDTLTHYGYVTCSVGDSAVRLYGEDPKTTTIRHNEVLILEVQEVQLGPADAAACASVYSPHCSMPNMRVNRLIQTQGDPAAVEPPLPSAITSTSTPEPAPDGPPAPPVPPVPPVDPIVPEPSPDRRGRRADGDVDARSALFVRLQYMDDVTTASEEDIRETVWSRTGQSVSGLISETSYGQASLPEEDGLVLTVVVPRPVAELESCPYWTMGLEADRLVREQHGIEPDSFQHRSYYIPWSTPGCTFGGLAYTGCSKTYCKSWIRTTRTTTVAHELGHNLGLQHAGVHTADFDSSFDPEYGDLSGVMGSHHQMRGFNAPHRRDLGWIPDEAVLDLAGQGECANSGQYRLGALYHPFSAGFGASVVEFARPAGGTYYVSLRTARGYDATMPAPFVGKVHVHYVVADGQISKVHAPLAGGDTFTDGDIRVHAYPGSITGDDATVFVELCGGDVPEQAATPSPPPPPPPATAAPTCADADSRGFCELWAGAGYCDAESVYRTWMAENCALSCSLCPAATTTTTTTTTTSTTPTTTTTTTTPTTTTTTTTTTPTTTTTTTTTTATTTTATTTTTVTTTATTATTTTAASTSPTTAATATTTLPSTSTTSSTGTSATRTTAECRDEDTRGFCGAWSSMGYCADSHQYGEWMQLNCALSCGVCSDATEAASASTSSASTTSISTTSSTTRRTTSPSTSPTTTTTSPSTSPTTTTTSPSTSPTTTTTSPSTSPTTTTTSPTTTTTTSTTTATTTTAAAGTPPPGFLGEGASCKRNQDSACWSGACFDGLNVCSPGTAEAPMCVPQGAKGIQARPPGAKCGKDKKCCSGVCGSDKRCTAVDGFPYVSADGSDIDWDALDDDEFEDDGTLPGADAPATGDEAGPATGDEAGAGAVVGAAVGACAVLAMVGAAVLRSRRHPAAAAAPPSPQPSDSATIWIGNAPPGDEDEAENVFVVNADGTMRVASVRRHSENPAWRRSSAGRASLGPDVFDAESAENTGAVYVIDCDGPAFRRATSVSSAGSETARRRSTDVSVVLEAASIDEEQEA